MQPHAVHAQSHPFFLQEVEDARKLQAAGIAEAAALPDGGAWPEVDTGILAAGEAVISACR